MEFTGLAGSGMEIGNRDGKEREGRRVEEVDALCISDCDQHCAKGFDVDRRRLFEYLKRFP